MDTKGQKVSSERHEAPRSDTEDRMGPGGDSPWGSFTRGLMAGVKPFWPAMRQLFVTALGALAASLLGITLLYAARDIEPPAQHLLTLAGEGVLLLAALVILIACIRVWCQVLQAVTENASKKKLSIGRDS